MTIVLTIAVFAVILIIAWGGMRLMQRTTGCTRVNPTQDPKTAR